MLQWKEECDSPWSEEEEEEEENHSCILWNFTINDNENHLNLIGEHGEKNEQF